MQKISMKTVIYLGKDSLNRLNEYEGENIYIVTDNFMVESGIVNVIVDEVKDKNKVEIFSDVTPNPTTDNVVAGVEPLLAFKPTIIIGFGGGSPIDAAKAIKLMAEQLNILETIRLVIIPTTSGTGSEVTNFSVITNSDTHLKYPLVDDGLQPDEAILDARLVKSAPKSITADTGMDVLTHALEAYVSTNATVYSDALAEKAIELIFANLVDAFKDGENIEARVNVHEASCLAGLAFNQASLGMCHGMAHSIGGKFPIAHGRINGILLPSVIKYNADESQYALDKYNQLAKSMGIKNYRGKMGIRNLMNQVSELRRDLNMPDSFKATGLTKEDLKPVLTHICEESLLDPTTATNPKTPTLDDVRKIVTQLF